MLSSHKLLVAVKNHMDNNGQRILLFQREHVVRFSAALSRAIKVSRRNWASSVHVIEGDMGQSSVVKKRRTAVIASISTGDFVYRTMVLSDLFSVYSTTSCFLQAWNLTPKLARDMLASGNYRLRLMEECAGEAERAFCEGNGGRRVQVRRERFH